MAQPRICLDQRDWAALARARKSASICKEKWRDPHASNQRRSEVLVTALLGDSSSLGPAVDAS
jgi:hypothetical protein